VSIFSKTPLASCARPARVRASTYQNEQRLKVPSPSAMPSWPVMAYRLTRLSETSSSLILSRVDRKRGSVGPANLILGITSSDASSRWLPGCMT
jgi:hypothetical protein